MVAAVFDFKAIRRGLDRLTGKTTAQGTHYAADGTSLAVPIKYGSLRVDTSRQRAVARANQFLHDEKLRAGLIAECDGKELYGKPQLSLADLMRADEDVYEFTPLGQDADPVDALEDLRAGYEALQRNNDVHLYYEPVVLTPLGKALADLLKADGNKLADWVRAKVQKGEILFGETPGEAIIPRDLHSKLILDMDGATKSEVHVYVRYSENDAGGLLIETSDTPFEEDDA